MLEERIQELTRAIVGLTETLQAQQGASAPQAASAAEKSTAEPARQSSSGKKSSGGKKSAAEETQSAAQACSQSVEAAADEVVAEVQDTAAEPAEEADTGLEDFDLGGDEGAAAEEPMGDDEFTEAWRSFTQRASKHATDKLRLDKEEAQREVKRHVVPLLKSFVGTDKPKVSEVPADLRRQFLAKAEEFFNKEIA